MGELLVSVVEDALKQFESALAIEAVVLVGSYARGQEHSLSDIDLLCVAQKGSSHRIYRKDSHVISLQCKTEKEVLCEFNSPHLVCQVIPSWRHACILYDPHNIAARLQEKSFAWTWEEIEQDIQRWAPGAVLGYVEEIFKILAGLNHNDETTIKVQACIVGIYLTPIYASIKHIFYESENHLWSGKVLDRLWHDRLTRIMTEPPRIAGREAISMFMALTELINPWMSQEQKQVLHLLNTKINEIGNL